MQVISLSIRSAHRYFLLFVLLVLASPSYAFNCSLFEGDKGNIPSFVNEIAELRNMEDNGRHIKLLVPREGAVEDFDLEQYISRAQTKEEIIKLLKKVEGQQIVYIDLFEAQQRYEVRFGTLTTNIGQVIKQTVYANFPYNTEHNEVYDLQHNLAVFCN